MRPFYAVLMTWCMLSLAAFALPAAADPSNDDSQLANINRRLSALATAPENDPSSATVPHPAAVSQFVKLSNVGSKRTLTLPPFLDRPQISRLISHYHQVDRMMHYQHQGFDVNLWGVLNRGRGLSVRFSRSF